MYWKKKKRIKHGNKMDTEQEDMSLKLKKKKMIYKKACQEIQLPTTNDWQAEQLNYEVV